MSRKTWSELTQLDSFRDRFDYLALNSSVGKETFGYQRYLNQVLYMSPEWKHLRRQIILRDKCCDMALPGFEIYGKVMIHHLNPITKEDVLKRSECIFDPENLVTVSFDTHNAIHYGNPELLSLVNNIERKPNDTCPWKG